MVVAPLHFGAHLASHLHATDAEWARRVPGAYGNETLEKGFQCLSGRERMGRPLNWPRNRLQVRFFGGQHEDHCECLHMAYKRVTRSQVGEALSTPGSRGRAGSPCSATCRKMRSETKIPQDVDLFVLERVRSPWTRTNGRAEIAIFGRVVAETLPMVDNRQHDEEGGARWRECLSRINQVRQVMRHVKRRGLMRSFPLSRASNQGQTMAQRVSNCSWKQRYPWFEGLREI